MDVSERISRRLPHKKSPSKPKKTLLITTTPTTITSTTTTTAKTEPRKKQIKTPVVVPIVQVPRIGKYVSTSASAIYTYDSLLLILSLFIFKLIIWTVGGTIELNDFLVPIWFGRIIFRTPIRMSMMAKTDEIWLPLGSKITQPGSYFKKLATENRWFSKALNRPMSFEG